MTPELPEQDEAQPVVLDWRARTSWLAVTQVLAAVTVVGYLAVLVSSPSVTTGSSTSLRWLQWAALTTPVLAIAASIPRRTRTRRAWLTMATGIAAYAVATVLADLKIPRVLLPSGVTASQVLFALSYLAVAVAAVLLMQHAFGVRMNSVRLDGAIAGLALIALTSMLWFRDSIRIDGRPLIAEFNIFNPPLVIVVIVLLLAGLLPQHFRTDVTTSLLLGALATFFIGDIVALNSVHVSVWSTGRIVGVAHVIGIYLLGAAAWPAEDRRRYVRVVGGVPTRGLILVPVIFGIMSTAVLVYSVMHPTAISTRFMALGSLSLVIARMVLTQNETRDVGHTSFVDARTDNLTGLANRRAFHEDGETRLASLGSTQQLGVAIIDLDGFKEINDTLGHANGDEILRIVGRRFSEKLGDRGIVSRVGGDEFAYTFVVESDEDPLSSAHGMLRSLASPISADGTTTRVSANIGVALFPQHGVSHAELFRSADVALYESKRHEEGVVLYRDDIDVNSGERVALTSELRTAIERHQLTLHFQPIHSLKTNQVSAVEALVRWHHDERGLLMPDEFIPLAERVGLIKPLTRTVLDMALTELTRLEERGYRLRVNVNISQWDLIDETLPESIRRTLDWYDMEPDRLTLEVTESVLNHDIEQAKRNLTMLRDTGVRIAVDNFGVGYSSLSELLELPADELKVDRSFVLAIENNPRAVPLIRSMIEMAHSLDLTATAEGLENNANHQLVLSLGADQGQGLHFSIPLDSEQLDEYLEESAARGYGTGGKSKSKSKSKS